MVIEKFLNIFPPDPPGPAKLTYSPWRVIKGKSLVLTCNVEEKGRPEAHRYRWQRGGRVVSDVVSREWTVDPVSVDHRADFACRAVGGGGDGRADSVRVDVLGEWCMREWTVDPVAVDHRAVGGGAHTIQGSPEIFGGSLM